MTFDLRQEFGELLVRILLALLIFVFIFILRRALTWLVMRPLRRMAAASSGKVDDVLYESVFTTVRLILLAIALDAAARVLALSPDLYLVVSRISRTLVVFAIASGAYGAVGRLTFSSNRLLNITGIALEEPLIPFVRTGLQFLILSLALIIIVQVWGYDVTGLVTGLGLGGLAISLAAQDTLANLFGFSMIVGDRPFVVGEFIKTPDVEGVVERVGLRSTRIRQLNQAIVTVPNSKLANSAILNWSRLTKRWIDFVLRIDFDTPPQQIETLLAQVRALLQAHPLVEPDSVVVHFTGFGEAWLELLVRAYVNQPDWLEFTQTKEEIFLDIMRIVRELKLEIAYPGRTLYIDKLPDAFQPIADDIGRQDDGGTQGATPAP